MNSTSKVNKGWTQVTGLFGWGAVIKGDWLCSNWFIELFKWARSLAVKPDETEPI
jgi:hypothetical protein